MELVAVFVLIAFAIWLVTRKKSSDQPPASSILVGSKPTPNEALRSGQPFTLEGRTYRLSGQGRVPVVGEAYRTKELARVVKGHRVGAAGDWDNALRRDAVLIPEPTNKHDSNAVRVLLEVGDDWAHVGYLSAGLASDYVGLCNQLVGQGRLPLVEGRVVKSANGHGVYLHLSDPDSCLFANDEPDADTLAPHRQCAVTRENEHQDVLGNLAMGLYWATLHPSTVTAGKHAGDFTIEVRIDDRRVGELTAAQGSRYRALVPDGRAVACEASVFGGKSCTEVTLMLPRVD